jgi:hypothetical protein
MKRQITLFVTTVLMLFGLVTAVTAQETTPTTTPPPPRLFITDSRTESPPAVDLRLYGIGAQGESLPLSPETVVIQHNGVPAQTAVTLGSEPVGTFTVFLIDIPPGVAAQFDAISSAIKQFAAAPNMQEQVDAAAIYQVGSTAAIQMMAPSTFYNDIHNTFASPLTPADGATALVDSIASLLTQIDDLKPNAAMAASIVVFSDGTDVVSTNDLDAIAPQAAALGIPLHTIWLENANLPLAGQQIGQDYLAEIAAGSRGRAATLNNDTAVSAIWQQITSFRDQTIIRYTPAQISGGTFPVTVTLTDNPTVQAETTVSLPANLPSVQFTMPPEANAISLPNLENPVALKLGAQVSWLDGEHRELVAASLLVNGSKVADIDPAQLDSFKVDIGGLGYGENSITLVVLDNQGLRATSPAFTLTVTEGDKAVPNELDAGGGFGAFVRGVLLLLAAIIGLGIALFVAWRQGWLTPLADRLPKGPSQKRPKPSTTITDKDGNPLYVPSAKEQNTVNAYLEVLAAESAVASYIPLRKTIVRIGRSPSLSDVAFENDLTVSRLHLTLRLEGNRYRIFDENSTSGTWVNDQQVPTYGIQLLDGDEIHMGAVHLRYHNESES